MVVALFIASVVAGLGWTLVQFALSLLLLDVKELVLAILPVDSTRRSLVANVTLLATPLGLTGAVKVSDFVNALAVNARVVLALVYRVQLTLIALGSSRTVTLELQVSRFGDVLVAGTTVVARIVIAHRAMGLKT